MVEAGACNGIPMAHPTLSVPVKNGHPLTCENYLNLNDVDEDDPDAERKAPNSTFSGIDGRSAGRVGDVRERD
jgi:hypothetical protein